jgi:hypothetical protein
MNVEIENEAARFHFLGIHICLEFSVYISVCVSLLFTKNAGKTQKSFLKIFNLIAESTPGVRIH